MQNRRGEGRVHRADKVWVIEVSSTAVVGSEELGVQQSLDASLKPGIVDVDFSEFVDSSVVCSHAKWDGMAKGDVGWVGSAQKSIVVATGNSCYSMEISSSSLPGYTMRDGAIASIPGGFFLAGRGVGGVFCCLGVEAMISW